jgi:glutathione peroxidase
MTSRTWTSCLGAIFIFMNSLSAAETSNLLTIPVKTIEGADSTLAATKGKAILVVNVASECGYTGQYAGLEALYKKYKDQGLVIAGFPCNDFGGQEPGTEKEIKKFCTMRFAVTFPLYSKITVQGAQAHPLFLQLTSREGGHPGPVTWNFNKFLISREGKLIARFDSSVEPDAPELVEAIKAALK